MSIQEYALKIKAKNLKDIDRQRDMHWAAFLNRVVQATDKKGNYVYKKFTDFFEEDKVLSKIDDDKNEEVKVNRNKLAQIAMKVNTKGG